MEALQGTVDVLATKLVEQFRNSGRADQVVAELRDVHKAVSLRGELDRQRSREIALDDFGTGFSSLEYLRNVEFDLLKIDKTFIDKLDSTRDYGLVASIISMGRILGMRVVAEGVEDASQVQRLRQIGCDYIQGFYYSRPLPAEDFYQFVTTGGLRNVG